MPDPLHQFELHRYLPINIGGWDLSFTNSAFYMLLATLLTLAFFYIATQARALVPGRMQSLAEVTYEFVANMVHESMGKGGMRFFPFVFAIFIFTFACNMLGMIPFAFTPTSHVAVTAALALLVFVTVIVAGFAKNGMRFLKLFWPSGIPIAVMPLIVLIEVISFFARPVSHSIRLFANMLAGHIALKVFGGFVVMLLGAGGIASALVPLPLLMAIALTALEVLVAFIQAYVFAMLTSLYLNDALHPGH
ncbi:MAG TPA: F0F1 ATP synthase subunit A [Hyphomicrobiaceae bacterium]|nr:F0F1 ATP synthase subunit A [Hyphomicrobiaceae bacterium]